MDAAWLKRIFLVGQPQTDLQGNAFPDEMYDLAIESALEEIEAEVGVSILSNTQQELHDLVVGDGLRNYQFQLAGMPVQSISEILFQHGDFTPVVIPPSWITIRNHDLGLVDLIQGQGIFQFIGGPYWVESGLSPSFLGWSYNPRLPAHLRVTYTSGFLPGQKVPAMVRMAVGYLAARLPMDTTGTLINGIGITSSSKSLDAISESVSTANSAQGHSLSALLASRDPQFASLMTRLRARFRVLPTAL